jgi:putative endonuclease
LKFWVYVLVSETTGKRYVGQTDDLHGRVAQHNDPAHNSMKFTTKHAGPWTLMHSEEYATRAEAMRRERWLKSGVGREWLDRTIGRASPPRAD